MNAVASTANETLTRTLFAVNGVGHELVTHTTGKGRVEVYVEYDDAPGLMQFRGYYDEICVNDHKLAARVRPMSETHAATHRDFWKGYLPGAQTWLHAT